MDTTTFDLATLLLRGVVGAVMLAHGINHVWGGGGIDGTTRWFDGLGMRPARFHAWLASLTEIAAGAMLVLGLATTLAAAGVVGVLVVAWVTNHRDAGFFVFRRPTEGWEYLLVLVVTTVVVAVLGGGAWSLDEVLGWRDTLDGWVGLVVAGGGGAGAAALTLAAYWRPAS